MRISVRRIGTMAVAALSLGGTILVSAPSAGATPVNGIVVAAAGSDTSEAVMKQILSSEAPTSGSFTLDIGDGNGAVPVRGYNIPASSTTAFNVPGESATSTDCPSDVSWARDQQAATTGTAVAATKGVQPFGSGAGRAYLKAEDGGTGPADGNGTPSANGTDFGCVDIARQSSGPRSGDISSLEYYAFAMDAVSWATTSTKAPPVLTHTQIKSIYNCTFTDWSQVGGLPGPIVRYLPQNGSGTRSFFISDVLGGATPDNSGNCATHPLQLIEENEATQIVAADLDKAILPYSTALWDFQVTNSANPTVDRRCAFQGPCAKLGAITTDGNVTAATNYWNAGDNQYEMDTTSTGVIKENNVKQANPSWSEAGGNFIGVRFIYNTLDSTGARRGYKAAKALVGFSNTAGGSKSKLCDGGNTGSLQQAFISSAGFAPLNPTVSGDGTSNNVGATCRLYSGLSA